MARGFGSTLGVAAGDKITGGAWTTPTVITFAGWYLRNGLGGLATGRLLDKTGLTAGEVIWRTSASGAVMHFERVFSGTDGVWEINDAEAVASGKWVHYVVCYDGSSASNDPAIYINGRFASGSFSTKTAPTGTVDSGSGVFCIGDRSTGGRDWDGSAGRTTVWAGITLTAAEARALYQGADPKTIRPLYIVEDLVLGDGLPYSTVRSTQPLVSGTKIRPDRLVITQGRVFPFGALTSGTTYNDTLTSTATATDGVTVTATFAPAFTETATAGDSVTVIATFNATLSQGVTATESSIGGSIFNDTLSQSAAATDTYAQSVVFGPSLTETATSADVYAVIATFAPAYGETATAGFSLSDGSAISIWTTIAPTSGAWGTQSASTGVWTTLPPSTGTWT